MHVTGIEGGLAGYYTFILNGEEVFSAPSKNLITDFGWSRLLNLTRSAASGSSLQVGTSNTPPAVTDSALGALLATKNGHSGTTNSSGTDTIGTYNSKRHSYAFPQGAVVGNVAEVGFKVSSGDASLTSRSLVKDGLGNPAVITVTAIDQLTVVYELRYYLNRTLDVTGSVTVAGVPTTWIIRASTNTAVGDTSFVDGYKITHALGFIAGGTGSTLGAPGAAPSLPGAISATNKALTGVGVVVNPTNAVLTYTVPLTIGECNPSGGIHAFELHPSLGVSVQAPCIGEFKGSFSPPIPKDGTKTLSITFTVTINRV